MASAFSAPDAAIITHEPALDERLLSATAARSGSSLEDLYDIERTASRIAEGAFKRVALQFPDEGLPDSVPIYWALRRELDAQERSSADLYILADTSYGNCCVDEVAAQHVDADVVVHYGHACLSPTARLPVIYVFPKRSIDCSAAANALAQSAEEALATWDGPERKSILLSYDVGYAHAAEDVFAEVQHRLNSQASGSRPRSIPPLVLARLDTQKNFESKLVRPPNSESLADHKSSTCASCSSCRNCCSQPPLPPPTADEPDINRLAGSEATDRQYNLPEGCNLEDTLILYIGGESLSLTNLLLRAGPACPVISYDPQNADSGTRREDGRTNRLLMRRYAAVQKARDASVVGLLVGTLGVQSYLPLLSHLRQLLTGRRPGAKKSTTKGGKGRKVYTISVGKLSPAKLANFQEIDVFVLLACPENSLVDAVDSSGQRSKEFYKPIVTPYEMILAMDDSRAWTGSYVLEMNRLALDAAEEDVNGGGDGAETKALAASDNDDEDEDEDRPHFSLVTGGYVSRKKFQSHTYGEEPDLVTAADGEGTTPQESSIVVRDASGQLTRILDSASAMHLSGRSWKGLEQRLGMDEPSVLEEGRAGIARQYAEADGTKEG